MSGLVNKVKDALHSDKSSKTSDPEGTHGQHSSRVANAADPRIDSDADHRADPTSRVGGTGTGTTGGLSSTGTYGTTGTTTSSGFGSSSGGVPEGTAGHHSSRLANAADPRIDSDLDNSRGATGTHGLSSTSGTGTTGSSGFGSSTGGVPEGTAGHHNSRLANAADPRIDSDLDNRRGATGTHGLGSTTGTGTTGSSGFGSSSGGVPEGTAGHHNSRLANAADPRIDSDLDSSRGAQGQHGLTSSGTTGTTGHSTTHGTTSSSTGNNTAGPHNSDLLNKLDPRVDSDLDGSKTYGGDKTHAGSTTTGTTSTSGSTGY